jgi:hypothetical protein
VYWRHGAYAGRIHTDTLPVGDPARTDPLLNLGYRPANVLMQEVARVGANWGNATDVATTALQLFYDQRWSAQDLSNAVGILNRGTPWPGSSNAIESERRARFMTAFLCALPQALEK